MKDFAKKRSYKVVFNEPKFNAIWTFELTKSGAFNYGNQTCVIIKENSTVKDMLDTRYEKDIVRNFDAWCDDYISHMFNPEYEPNISIVE